MKKILLLALVLVACSKETKVITVTAVDGQDGKDGTSCTVSPEVDEESQQIGSRISCTDGSYSIVYNGTTGAQGPQGNQGVQGPVGQNGKSCQTYKLHHVDGVFLSCPNQLPMLISNGKDGENGKSCSSLRENSKNRVRITCGETVTYVYDGDDGKDGKSCTVTSAAGGANVKCGNDSSVFIANGAVGAQGTVGPKGEPGRDGLNGINGVDGEDAFLPGLSCNLHDLKSWDSNSSLPEILKNNAPVGNFVLANLSVPDSQSSLGFPGMPKSLQNIVGLEGYALDCYAYLNVETSGEHILKLLSDDGSALFINNSLVINNQGLHAPQTVTKTVTLYRGPNKINVVYYQGPATQIALELRMSGPNTAEQVVPSTQFRH